MDRKKTGCDYVDLSMPVQHSVDSCCEHSNEHSVSLKFRTFPEKRFIWVSNNDLHTEVNCRI